MTGFIQRIVWATADNVVMAKDVSTALHTWVINLDQDKERLSILAKQLQPLGLPWTRIPAVLGRALSKQEQDEYLDAASFEKLHGMSPSLGELGCYLSHVAALRAFLESPHEFALILEDDAGPTPDILPVLSALVTEPEHWDMVKLSGVHRGTPLPVKRLTENHQLAVMLSGAMGSSAYLISRPAAEKYLARLLPMQLPYDHSFERPWFFDLRILRVLPWVVEHDTGAVTTIISPGSARKFHWTRRRTTYAYRIGRDLRRLANGLKKFLLVGKKR
jgi:glycosyl transferase, family 25